MQDIKGKVIWIIGASSGIGYALAEELERRGAELILSARNETALNSLRDKTGGTALVAPLDVQRPEEIAKAYQNILKNHMPDSVIFLAGAYKPMKIDALDLDECANIISTNLNGAIYTVRTVLPDFLKRRAGQIVLCGSVAGYRGLPNAQPYGATKAALINFAESLYAECAGSGIDVKLISPGFVKTRLTDQNSFKMPMLVEPADAARLIADGLCKTGFEIHFPKPFTIALKILQLLPAWLYFKLVSRQAH